MKKTTYFLFSCLFAFSWQIQAQTHSDVTDFYLTNAGFDKNFNYSKTKSGNVAGDIINDVFGWNNDNSGTYTVAGTFAYGSGATFNSSSAIPNTGYNDSEGGALALSTGWGTILNYSQPVTLIKGEYTLVSVYYNVGTATTGSSLLGWIPESGKSALSEVSSYPVGAWTTDTIHFTISEKTKGKIQIGLKTTAATGSGSHAKVLVDYVKLIYSGVDKTELNTQIGTANTLYGNGSGLEASALLTATNVAKAVANNTNATILEVLNATSDLEDAIFAYQLLNASESTPLDLTRYITNPSFESAFNGWTNNGFSTQTNASFLKKAGSTYIENWVNIGSLVPDVSIQQELTNMPNGKYTLTVAAGNIQQKSSGSSENKTATPQTGAVIFARNETIVVDTVKDRSIDFLIIDKKVTVGLKAESATGNWVTCDNFRLEYKGLDINAIADFVKAKQKKAQDLSAGKMQNTAKQGLNTAISQAGQAAAGTLVLADLDAANESLIQTINTANISIAAYAALQIAVDSAVTVYDAGKNEAAAFQTAISNAQAVAANLDATLDEIYSITSGTYKAIFAFRLANATGAVPTVTTNLNYVRGATAALGRLTVSGSGIMERGFCWSTHPEPTVLDNRTTKYFTNNGSIYHIENLEPATIYYMRAYALTNTYAVGYGNVVKVITVPKGKVTYQLNASVTNSVEHFPRISAAVSSAVDYFNNYTSIQGHHLSVNYNAGTPTAEASYGGYMQFGATPSYQQTGTALHEMGHTIGVGQHTYWTNTSSSPLKVSGQWTGERANKVVQFFDNNTTSVLKGDGTHMWPYGINGAHEDNGTQILYIANSLIHQAIGEDGLPPIKGGFTTPAYTFAQTDGVKYYIKNEDETRGRNNSFLMENAAGNLVYQEMNAIDALANDSTAWYFEFNPATAYYQIRNAATNKYFTYKTSGTNGITLASKGSPAATENFQLMNARTNTKIGVGTTAFTTKGYWIIRPQSTATPPCFTANANGVTAAGTFSILNTATTQRWLLLTGDEVNLFEKALTVTGININKKTLTLTEGETGQLTATLAPSTARNQNVTWSSDNEDIATVSPSGLVTAVAKGEAIISVTSEEGGFTASCTTTVNPHSSIEGINAESLNLYPNPATNWISLTGLTEEAVVSIYNISGLEVKTCIVNADEKIAIDFASGVYFVKIQTEGKEILQKLVVKP